MREFWAEQGEWSSKTFGPVTERGPLGPLKHLRKEIDEVIQELERGEVNRLALLEELADLQFLTFDAVRRARFSYDDLHAACFNKLDKNKKREWPDWRTA